MFSHVIFDPHPLNRTGLMFSKYIILHLGKWEEKKKKLFNLLCFDVSFKYSMSLMDTDPNHMHAALLVLILAPLKSKKNNYITIYQQHKSSFYILVAMFEMSATLQYILHFLFIFALCLCMLLYP